MESTKNPLAPLSKKIQTQRHFPYPPFGHPHKTFIHLPFNNSPLLPALLFAFLLLARSTQKISQLNPLILAEKLAYKEWTFYALLGLIASELTHISLDLLWSFWRRIKPF
jgi:hypothetical protein